MIRLWCRRPLKKGSARPVTRKSAINLVGELGRFFRWLHRSPQHSWRKPTDFDEIEVSVDKLPSDSSKLGRVSVFSLEELILLNQYASPLERVFLLLGLNCGFGIAEIASLETGEVHLFEAHERRLQPIFNCGRFVHQASPAKEPGLRGILAVPTAVLAMQWALQQSQEGKLDRPRNGGKILAIATT